MFDCAITLMIQFVELIPAGVVLILVFNLIRELLFN